MRASTALRRASQLHDRADALLVEPSRALADLLDDDCAHFSVTPNDGVVVVWGDGHNNSSFVDVDALLRLSREEALEVLEAHGI